MSPEEYIPLIRDKYPDEDPKDVLTMMGIVASARAEARGGAPTRADLEFGGKILCVIFDPIKIKIVGFSDQTKSLRRAYRGIADSPDLQEMFRESLRPELLSAEEASEAIQGGVDALFRLPATFEDES